MFKQFQVNPFDLLGQEELYPRAVSLPGNAQVKLEIAWNSFHQNFFSGIPVFFQRTRLPKDAAKARFFRGSRVEGRVPRKAILAAALWHVAIFVVPWPQLPAAQKRSNPFENTELTWSGPIEDLPLVNIPKAKPKTVSQREVSETPPAANGADAFHPRQRIFTDPVHPTHPRQTLVNTAAPPVAPKILPTLPNIVQLATIPGPARPRLEISEQTLAKLRPREVKRRSTTDTPSPDLPNMEQRAAAMSLASVEMPAKPKLEINAGSAPRMAERNEQGEVVPPPEVPAANAGATGGPSNTLIALSAAPAPPTPVVAVPQGNLAARVSISPEGKQPGTPGGTGTAPSGVNAGSSSEAGLGGGKSDIGITISGGNPKPKSTVAGLGDGRNLSFSKSIAAVKRPDPNAVEDVPDRGWPPNFATLPPGAKPEQIFSTRHVYSMNVNMPNLNSVTGSWIIRFSELHLGGGNRDSGTVSAPVPVVKVDPKYPQTLVEEHVEGEVILYGVIRPDGSVDSIQLVRGIDEQLDANSIAAFSQWKFEPGTREGQPVPLEAIVHIPFRGPGRQ